MSKRRIELSTTQVIASVLAGVSGAILASFLGVGGTLIGAAVVSFASTAGTAVYRDYLARTQEKLKSAATGVAHRASLWGEPGLAGADSEQTVQGASQDAGRPATERPGTERTATERSPAASGHNGPGTGAGAGRPDISSPPGRRGILGLLGRPGKARWLVLAGATVLIFVVTMAGVTLLEAATGKPLDALVWGRHNSGTTVGNAVSGGTSHPRHGQPHRSATPGPSARPTRSGPSPGRTATPAPSPSPSGPTPTPSPTPSLTPTPSPSATAAAARGPATLPQ